MLAVAIAASCVIALVDYGLRLEDSGTRLLLTLLWLGSVGVAVWYWLLPAFQAKWPVQTVAAMIEKRFPKLDGSLSSSVAFLTEGDNASSSKSLMRNVINATAVKVEQLDLREAIDYRPTTKMLGWFTAAVLVAFGIFCADPSTAGKAFSRLLLPLSDNPWPRVNYLAFVEPPTKVARGGDVTLKLTDESGKLPPRVDIQLWHEGQSESDADVIPMSRVDNYMVIERSNVTRAFKFRAAGGDDHTMEWRSLDVVEPPQIVSGQMQLTPPTYTGWEARTLEDALASVRVLEGTSVLLSGTADRELTSGILQSHAGDASREYAASISSDGRQYAVPSDDTWKPEQTSEYSLTLVDRDGTQTVDADRWSLRVLPDESPTVRFLDPSSEELVTPQAVIPIRCDVEDDLATKLVELRFLRTDQSEQGEVTTSLFEGPATLPRSPMPEIMPPPVDKRELKYAWALEPLRLNPGVVLSYSVSAEDYKSQSNQTLARRLVVVSETDLVDRAGRRQSLVLSRLQQRLKQQRQAKQHLEAVRLQLAESDQVEKETMDRLQAGVLAQRKVNTALNGEDAEVVKELEKLQGLLDRSRVGEVDVRSRIESTLASIRKLGQQHLDPAMRHGESAKRALRAMRDQGAKEIPPDVPQDLQTATENQSAAIGSLEKLLDDMSAWDNYRRFAQELSDLLRQQRDVKRTTQKLATETLARNGQQLDGKQRAAVKAAAARQLELARRMDRTLENLSKAEQEMKESDPQAAQMVSDAMQAARDNAVSGHMRQAGRQIDQSRLGLAGQQQEKAESALEEMLDQLSRRSLSPEERVQKLSDVERQLERLQKRQAELSKDLAEANRERNAQKRNRELQRLSKRQKQLAEETKRLQRQLQRLRANDASQQAGQASSSMDQASSAAEQGDGQQAQKKSELAEAQMEQAQQSLQQEKEEAKSQLAQEQMVRLPQLVEALIAQQANVVEEIERLDQVRTETGELTSGQQASVEVTAEVERAVAQDIGMVSNQVSQLPAFVFALTEAQTLTSEVAESLADLDTSDQIQKLATRVLDQLQAIREKMKSDPSSPQQQQGGGGGGGGQQQGGNGPGFDPRLAQLKLLRDMQVAINEETEQLAAMEAIDFDARRALDKQKQSLTDRQGELARVLKEMLESAKQPQPLGLPEPDGDPAANDAAMPDLDALDRELDELLK